MRHEALATQRENSDTPELSTAQAASFGKALDMLMRKIAREKAG